ncbi:dihydroneopterin aldolase/2-amino-4-hydroxy-6-hydroxymethyldihydropteridine diphosphokinase,TIGR01498 [Eubacterium ruminantium]|nr:dihydroneopterin aldolase/2-amino-4-hydroxy-6-hydroxymethyldihydropteridine diphosphokinase,TIGR01498 [Eubacterium ruminantium]
MDKIVIKNLNIFAFHGVFDEEKEKGQIFRISAELYLSVRKAAMKDDLRLAVNYAEVAELIRQVTTREKCDLIETVAENIAAEILIKYNMVKGVRVKVSKPDAPIDMSFEDVAVEVNRFRHVSLLGLGSNLGDREKYIKTAIEQLGKDDYIKVKKVSSFIETEPYGPVDQPDFLNAAVLIETLYTAEELLEVTSDIELDAKRERIIHWGPRTLDIDLLLFDDEIISTEKLTIPHKEMHLRDFVLRPADEIAPYMMHPLFNKTIHQLLTELHETEEYNAEAYIDEEYEIVDNLEVNQNTRVVYAGVPGAYAEAAVVKYFGNDISIYNVKHFDDIAEEVISGRADYGVIPIENSSAGFVSGNYDIIRSAGVKIVAEVVLDIEHCLLGIPGASINDIKKVFSHDQGLMQCKDYIDKHGFSAVSMSNTAAAAKKVREEGNLSYAAIASERAARLYNLTILESGINTLNDNSTKFVVVTGRKIALKEADNISLCFRTAHKVGALFNVMKYFNINGLNMTSIESRPSQKKKWQYYFYVTFNGRLTDKNVMKALGEIEMDTDEMEVLGTF